MLLFKRRRKTEVLKFASKIPNTVVNFKKFLTRFHLLIWFQHSIFCFCPFFFFSIFLYPPKKFDWFIATTKFDSSLSLYSKPSSFNWVIVLQNTAYDRLFQKNWQHCSKILSKNQESVTVIKFYKCFLDVKFLLLYEVKSQN